MIAAYGMLMKRALMAHEKKLMLLGIKQFAAFVAKKFSLQFKMQGRLENHMQFKRWPHQIHRRFDDSTGRVDGYNLRVLAPPRLCPDT